MDFDDEWSDDEEPAQASTATKSTKEDGSDRVNQLEAELEKAKADVKRLQNLVQEMTNDESDSGEQIVLGPGVKNNGKGKGKAVRDDDTHYFDSYEHNGESLIYWVELMVRYPRDHVEGYYQDCHLCSILIVEH